MTPNKQNTLCFDPDHRCGQPGRMMLAAKEAADKGFAFFSMGGPVYSSQTGEYAGVGYSKLGDGDTGGNTLPIPDLDIDDRDILDGYCNAFRSILAYARLRRELLGNGPSPHALNEWDKTNLDDLFKRIPEWARWRDESLVRPTLTWRETFNSKPSLMSKNTAATLAAQAGYSFYVWDDRVYDTATGKDAGVAAEDVT